MPQPPRPVSVDFHGERFTLLGDRALYWPARDTLVVADVHLGKGAALRRAGLPVPSGNSVKDLNRLDALLAATSAARLAVLGDLVHARHSHQQELQDAVAAWRRRHPAVEVLLVRGNHDRGAGRLPPAWGVREVEEPYDDGGVLLAHAPAPRRPAVPGRPRPPGLRRQGLRPLDRRHPLLRLRRRRRHPPRLRLLHRRPPRRPRARPAHLPRPGQERRAGRVNRCA